MAWACGACLLAVLVCLFVRCEVMVLRVFMWLFCAVFVGDVSWWVDEMGSRSVGAVR